jgi:hypothetical protein
MQVFRSDSGDLHREGLPCIETNDGTQIYCWNNRIHNSRGPAVISPYGTTHYYWRGIHVDCQLWADMPKMTAKDLMAMDNAELRRVALERIGYDRLTDQAKVIDETPAPEGGNNKLYHLDLKDGDDDKVAFLELLNSTPELDGSRKKYFLRVPPATKTVREGVAWTFELEDVAYNFLVET